MAGASVNLAEEVGARAARRSRSDVSRYRLRAYATASPSASRLSTAHSARCVPPVAQPQPSSGRFNVQACGSRAAVDVADGAHVVGGEDTLGGHFGTGRTTSPIGPVAHRRVGAQQGEVGVGAVGDRLALVVR